MITSPILGLPVLEGSDPVAQIDDWCQQFVAVLEARAPREIPMSFRLFYLGTMALPPLTDVTFQYSGAEDETDGAGILPTFDLDGVTIPHSAVYHVEAFNNFSYTTGPDVVLDTGLTVDGIRTRAGVTALSTSAVPNGLQHRMAWTGWLNATEVVRGFARAALAGATLTAAHLRVVGPLT